MSKTQYIYLALALLVIVVLVGMLMKVKVKEGFCYPAVCGYMFPADGKIMTNLKRVRCSQPWHDCPNEFTYEGHVYKNTPSHNTYWSATAKKQIDYYGEMRQRENPFEVPSLPGGGKKKKRFGLF